MELQQVIDAIVRRWKFNEHRYPEMKGRTPQEQRIIAVRHIVLHNLKEMHPFMEFLEEYDHGLSSEISSSQMHKLLGANRKLVQNALRMSEILGETAGTLGYWLLTE